MTTSRPFNIIIPRIDGTGPVNVAIDIGREAQAAGYEVTVLCLSGEVPARGINGVFATRRFRLTDLWRLRGIIHTHCLRPDLLGGLMGLLPGRTLVTTIHNYFLADLGFSHPKASVRTAWWLWKLALRGFDHRVGISRAMVRYYARAMPGSRVELCYNFRAVSDSPQPPANFDAWVSLQRAAGRIVLSYVGSLSARKNVLGLIEAVAAEPDLAVVICGGGPLASAAEALAARPDLAGRVLLLGHLRGPEGVVARTDMLVLPSFAEGLPLVVLEALRVGRPSLMSNIAVHRELAAMEAGVTFDQHRFKDFAEKARALAAQNSPRRAAELESVWSATFSPTVGFGRYRKLLGERDPREGDRAASLRPK